MGLFDKLKFWKKEDDFDFDSLTSGANDPFTPKDDLGLNQPQASPGLGLDEKSPFEQLDQHTRGMESSPAPAPMPQNSRNREGGSGGGRDLELINSKLDTIKALLNSIDQRVANLERSSGLQKEEKRLW